MRLVAWVPATMLALGAATTQLARSDDQNSVIATTSAMPTVETPQSPQPAWQSPGVSTYYLDSVLGDDTRDGLSPATAWRTLGKVNAGVFAPGDKILLKTGSVWNNEQLYPKGSGADGKPITIDSYGDGPKPVIYDNMHDEAAVQFINQQYWEINNLEITNDNDFSRTTDKGHYVGILLTIEKSGSVYHHLYIRNCYIHDVDGDPNYSGADDKTSGGISGRIHAAASGPTGHYEDIRIENNKIERVSRTGICLFGDAKGMGESRDQYSRNLHLSGNTIERPAGDAIILAYVNDALVEHNVVMRAVDRSTAGCAGVWGWYIKNVVYQFNECAYITKARWDGEAWDFDYGNVNVTYQYNYSHDNKTGWLLMMANPPGVNLVARYNISANEAVGYGQGPQLSAAIYNNTFYHDKPLEPRSDLNSFPAGVAKAYNNLFYECPGLGSFRKGSDHDYNAYYNSGGDHGEAHAVTADPMLAGLLPSGSPGDGLATCDIFRLKPGSPLTGAGLVMPNPGRRDFFGNPLPSASPSIGTSQ